MLGYAQKEAAVTVEEIFNLLEEKIDGLVKLVGELKEENRQLREESGKLKAQTEEALKRINFMVDKLSGVV